MRADVDGARPALRVSAPSLRCGPAQGQERVEDRREAEAVGDRDHEDLTALAARRLGRPLEHRADADAPADTRT